MISDQIAREHDELVSASYIQYGPQVQRCHFCGRVSRTLTRVELRKDGVERHKGECCNG